MSPGEYLASEREAAGVRTHQIMARLVLGGMSRTADMLEVLLPAIERDLVRADTLELMALRICFPFSPGTYRRLCAEADQPAAPPTESNQNGQ